MEMNPPLKVFIGYDPRQPIAYNVCRSSIERHASGRVQIEPLILKNLPITRKGLTEFTYSRYLVPYLCDYRGKAVFLDGDIILLGDILEMPVNDSPVAVVKNPRVRFEWPSVMYFDNALCSELTPEYIEKGNPQSFEWASHVGELPKEWNHCVGYDSPNPDAKVIHFTAGIPVWEETKDCERSIDWYKEFQIMNSTVSYDALMKGSVHDKNLVQSGKLKAA